MVLSGRPVPCSELFDQLTYETKIQLAKAMQSENSVTVRFDLFFEASNKFLLILLLLKRDQQGLAHNF